MTATWRVVLLAIGGMLLVLTVGVGSAVLIAYLVPGGGQVVEKVRCNGQSPSFGICARSTPLGPVPF